MQRNLVPWAREALTAAGVALVAAFFLSWTDLFESKSGLGLAWDEHHWLFLVPLSGIALAIAARGPFARLAAIAAGLLVADDVLFEVVRGVVEGGLPTWLVFGGAGLALAAIPERRQSWRVVAGIAILAGFFAPWDDQSMFAVLRDSDMRHLADAWGLHLSVLWLVPVGGVCALAAASGPKGRILAAVAGVLVLGSMGLYIGSAMALVFAWGAWITLGASATALVLAVIAPNEAPPALPLQPGDATE